VVDDLNLREPDPVEWDSYDEGGGKFKPLAPEGIYTVVEVAQPTIGSRDGYLSFTLANLKIVDEGPGKDQEIRFADISTKKWPNRNGSSMGDYLRAHGVVLQGKPTNDDYKAAVGAVNGRPFKVSVVWNGRCPVCATYFRKADSYPTKDDGTKQSFMDCPNGCKDPSGVLNEATGEVRASRVFANLKVGWFVSAVSKK
jgi:hypothetical protein